MLLKNILTKIFTPQSVAFAKMFSSVGSAGMGGFGAQAPTSIDFGGPLGSVSASEPGKMLNGLANFLYRVAIFVAVLIIIINGIKMMLAGGDSNKVKDSMNAIKDAITGLLLAVLAAGIVKMLDSWLPSA